MPLLLISGRPGTGKSTFCKWLAQHRGYVHVETDVKWAEWGHLLVDTSFQSAVVIRNRLRLLGKDVVIEWGFLTSHIGRIRQLRGVGIEPWWFDGDESAARESYLQREGVVSIPMYENQILSIDASWPSIKRVYGDHIICTVSPGPTYLSGEQICTAISVPRLMDID